MPLDLYKDDSVGAKKPLDLFPKDEPSFLRKADIALGKIAHPLMFYSGLEAVGRLWEAPANIGYGVWEGGKKALKGDIGAIVKEPAKAAVKTLKGEGYYGLEEAGLPVPKSQAGRIAAELAWGLGKNPLNVLAPYRGRLITKLEPPKPVPAAKLSKIDPESIGKKEAPRPIPKAAEVSDVERIEALIDEIRPKQYLKPEVEKPVVPERIVAPATKHPKTGKVYEGVHHGESMEKAGIPFDDPMIRSPIGKADRVNGFVTNRGRFVDRKEALTIARKAKQTESAAQSPGAKELAQDDLDAFREYGKAEKPVLAAKPAEVAPPVPKPKPTIKKSLIPESLEPALDVMKDQVRQGDVQRGERHIIGSTYPDWFRRPNVEKKKWSRKEFDAIIKKAEKGDYLTPKQTNRFAELLDHAKEVNRTDRSLVAGQDMAAAVKKGFEPVYEKRAAGDFEKGDSLIIRGEEYTHKGYGKDGKAIIEDGTTIKADPFELLDVEAIKRGPPDVLPVPKKATLKEPWEMTQKESFVVKENIFDKQVPPPPKAKPRKAKGTSKFVQKKLFEKTQVSLFNERGSVELPSLEPLKRTVENLEESMLVKGAKQKFKRTAEGLSEALHSPERVYQKDPAGKEIYKLIDTADQRKNAFLYQQGKELKLATGKIKEGSVESVRVGQTLDGKLNPASLTVAERKTYDFMKKSYDFMVQKYARVVAGSEGAYKRALNASLNKHAAKAKVKDLPEESVKLYERLKEGLQYVRKGRPLKELSEAERAKYWQVRQEMRGLQAKAWKETLTEGEAAAYDVLTRRIKDYLPHIFDKDELLIQFKAEAAQISKKLETATHPGAITQYKTRLQMLQDAVVKMEKGGLVTYEALPRNVRFRFFETRKGAAGYSFDSVKAYQTYLHGIARKIYDEPAIRQAASLHEKIDPSLKGYNRWYLRHYMGWDRNKLDDLAGTIASFEWMRTLGANPRSAIVNLTQRLNTIAEVGVKHSVKGEALAFTKRGRKLFDQTGIAKEVPTVLLEGPVPEGMEKARAILGYMFNKVELGNRKHAFLSSYSRAKAAGISEKEAIRAGIDTVHKTQFRYGKVGMPKALTHPVGRLAGQFMSYPIKQIELITDWAKNDPGKLIKYLAMAEGGNLLLNEFLGIDLSNALGFGLNYGEAFKALQDIPKNDWRAFFRHVNLTVSSGGGLLPSGLGPSVSGAMKVAKAIGKGYGFEQLKKELTPVQYKRISAAYKAVMNRRGELYPMHDRNGHVMYFLTAPQLATRTIGPRTAKESRQYTDWSRSNLLENERQDVLRDITKAIVDNKTDKANKLIDKYKIVPTDGAIEKEALRRKATREELGRLKVPGPRDLWQLQREGRIIP